ncbi:MAG: sugar phosphate isomerase/epimerase [Pirellulales bacterium]
MTGFKYCFNTSTIRGQKLSLPEEIDIVAQAGYHAIEPWIGEIEAYVQQGGSLADLKKRIADVGLTVESSIGFAEWIVDDEARRTKGLEQARRDFELVQQIGGKRMAAPAAGATEVENIDYLKVAERYHALLILGDHFGVVPQVEVWGFSKVLTRLGQAAFVAIESGHSQACVLPDVYHLYKGGSNFAGLGLLNGNRIHVFHVNDYPDTPPRAAIKDSDRVYPGDGVAPLPEILAMLKQIGFHGHLSVELFNQKYWHQDPLLVAKTALEKLRSVAERVK